MHRTIVPFVALSLAAPALAQTLASAEDSEGPNTGALPQPAEAVEPEGGHVHLTLGLDVATSYFFRGLNQEDAGLIAQPYADVTIDLLDDGMATMSFGTWNSVHGAKTFAATTDSFLDNWYESDVYAGISASAEGFTFGATYYFYASPSGAYGTIDELVLSASFDDSEHLEEFSLQPSVLIAFETGTNAADGQAKGVYLQLGIEPGIEAEVDEELGSASITFPVAIGLSLDDYYQDSTGNDEFFGFATIGVKVSVPLPMLDGYGSWSAGAGAHLLVLGDAAEGLNTNDDIDGVLTLGLSAEY